MKKIISALLMLVFSFGVLSEECPEGEYFVKGHHRNEYVKKNGTHYLDSFVKETCKKYRDGHLLIKKFIDTPPDLWNQKKEKFKKWNKKEKNFLLNAFEELPEPLVKNLNFRLHRAFESNFKNNPASCIPEKNLIVFYDSFFKENSSRVLAHELAHFLYSSIPKEKKERYKTMALWLEDENGNILISRKDGFVEEDSRIGPEEDFANNVEYYLFDKAILEKKSNMIYNWIEINLSDDLFEKEKK